MGTPTQPKNNPHNPRSDLLTKNKARGVICGSGSKYKHYGPNAQTFSSGSGGGVIFGVTTSGSLVRQAG